MPTSKGQIFLLETFLILLPEKIGTYPATIGDYHFDGSGVIYNSDMSNSFVQGN